jgi:SAM-dependent methyltransferase
MAPTPDEQALIDRFSATYQRLTSSEIMLGIERAVCGCDYGCTSWTTLDETRGIVEMLGLAPGVRLLDIGSGSGWPALYLAQESGCDVTLSDLPLDGLLIARKRAEADGLSDRCRVAQADGAALPFKNAAFDAIYHSDVLCCLVEKLAVLQSCRRVIRKTGRMVFSVILIAPGLSEPDYAVAADGGPTFIETGIAYPEMLKQSGWEITGHIDQTADYFDTFRKMFELEKANEDELIRLRGPEGSADLLAHREATLISVDRGLLRRELFSVAPAGTK